MREGPYKSYRYPSLEDIRFRVFASHGGHFHASLMKGKWILSANPDRMVANDEDSPIQYIGYVPTIISTRLCFLTISQVLHPRRMPEDPHRPARRPRAAGVDADEAAHLRVRQQLRVEPLVLRASRRGELGMDFVGGWQINQRYGGWNPDVRGPMTDIEDRKQRVINLGRLNQTEFMQQVGMSRVMVASVGLVESFAV